jgi:hypothetical protein
MTIFDARNVAPKQARAFFDITLRKFLLFAERAETITYYDVWIISNGRARRKLDRRYLTIRPPRLCLSQQRVLTYIARYISWCGW